MRLIMTDGIGKVPQDGPMQTVCLTSRGWKDTNMVCLCLPHKDLITSMPYNKFFAFSRHFHVKRCLSSQIHSLTQDERKKLIYLDFVGLKQIKLS